MKTWLEHAVDILEAADKKLPADMDIKERRKALSKERTSGYSVTSWGRKVWPKAMKKVLSKHIKSDASIPQSHMSPMERMMARAKK